MKKLLRALREWWLKREARLAVERIETETDIPSCSVMAMLIRGKPAIVFLSNGEKVARVAPTFSEAAEAVVQWYRAGKPPIDCTRCGSSLGVDKPFSYNDIRRKRREKVTSNNS